MIASQQKTHNFKKAFCVLALFLVISLLMVETLSAETRYRVKSSDHVNSIVKRHYPNSSLTRGQLLVGILMKNPRAFKGGNVNFLLRGKRLVLPDESDLQTISPEKASELLSEHARFFRFGISGDLPTPTLAEMEADPEESNEAQAILLKQNSQNKKIDQLQQESNDLKKQLEALLNERTERDERLLELEKSLKKSLEVDNQSTTSVEGNAAYKPTTLQQESSKKSDSNNVEVTTTSNDSVGAIKSTQEDNVSESEDIGLNLKVNTAEVISEAKSDIGSGMSRPEPSGSSLSKLFWLIPLILLGLFLYYIFGKKKGAPQDNEAVEINDSGYIEPYESDIEEIQSIVNKEAEEESSLETSVKLDVARAYIEAEDTESAVDILSEIIQEGSVEQKQQANDLLKVISSS